MTLSPSDGPTRPPHAEQRTEALRRVVSILLQGIGLHGFRYERDAFQRFQTGIRKVRAEFDEALDEDTVTLLVAMTIDLMEHHSREAKHYLTLCRNETEAAIARIAETLGKAAGGASEILVCIKEAEHDLSETYRSEEIAAARSRLSECIKAMRRAVDAKAEAGEQKSGGHDQVTGLPDSGYAEAEFGKVWSRRQDYYVAIFAMERVEAINRRFGFKTGDEVLSTLSQHVAQKIKAGDDLFRWRGPCLVALLERQVHERVIAAELSRIAGTRLEHAIKMKERDVIVPIALSWKLVPLAAVANVEDLVSNLNDFAAQLVPRGRIA